MGEVRSIIGYADGEPIYADEGADARELATREAPPTPGCIYFLQATYGGPIKIGFSRNLGERFRQIQDFNPVRLKITHSLPGTPRQERALHERFADYRLQNEWFLPCPELVERARARADVGEIEYRPWVSRVTVRTVKTRLDPEIVQRRKEREQERRYAALLQEQRDWYADCKRRGLRSTPGRAA